MGVEATTGGIAAFLIGGFWLALLGSADVRAEGGGAALGTTADSTFDDASRGVAAATETDGGALVEMVALGVVLATSGFTSDFPRVKANAPTPSTAMASTPTMMGMRDRGLLVGSLPQAVEVA